MVADAVRPGGLAGLPTELDGADESALDARRAAAEDEPLVVRATEYTRQSSPVLRALGPMLDARRDVETRLDLKLRERLGKKLYRQLRKGLRKLEAP